MLIRFVAQNVYSFFESKEFNMLPRPKIRTPEGHKYNLNGVELLKLSAIYGANGAGKSNLVKALGLLQKLAIGEVSANKIHDARFKFDQSEQAKQLLSNAPGLTLQDEPGKSVYPMPLHAALLGERS